jgi:cob(I)alamin adenosyltransferase
LASETCPSGVGSYLNRLSDWLFVMARYCNHLEGESDILWGAPSEK